MILTLGGPDPIKLIFGGPSVLLPPGAGGNPPFHRTHKWPSKDARGPPGHFGGRMDSIGQDLRG